MFSFRQKIFLSYAIGFIFFLFALFPLSSFFVRSIVENTMELRSKELIDRIKYASDDEELIKNLKDQKQLLFFRVSVITDKRKVLYDSHTKRLLGPRFSQEYVVDHPEVQAAFKTGLGYHEDWSDLLGQKFAYMATAFDFHGKTYILRTAFPYRYLSEIQNDFEIGFLVLATLVLVIFSLMSWLILNHFTRPIERIVEAVRPFQDGSSEVLPFIKLQGMNPKDDFALLAGTLNSLNSLIQEKIEFLKKAGVEKEVLLESLIEGVIAVDPVGAITFANESALNFFGKTKDDLIGQTFLSLHQKKTHELALDCQSAGIILNGALELKPHTSTFFLNVTAAPKTDNTGALIVLEDTTREVQILEMRKDFIANASHELKTPITIIQGFAEMLHDNPTLPPKTTAELTEKIVRNCTRMTTLIKDLLALADIENLPASRLSEFDLFELIEKSKQITQELYNDAEITIEGTRPLYIIGDPEIMEMGILNLVNNAVKYSNPPAKVVVTATKNNHEAVIRVKDHGIGIPQNDISRLFERFFRVDKVQSRKVGGSGLGLSIVQTVVKKHKGSISVESELGKGTEFTIKIPLNSDIAS